MILEPIEGHKHDFVNASYVDVSLSVNCTLTLIGIVLLHVHSLATVYFTKGYSSRKKFIATQGQSKQTYLHSNCKYTAVLCICTDHLLMYACSHKHVPQCMHAHMQECIHARRNAHMHTCTQECTQHMHCNAELSWSYSFTITHTCIMH